MKQRDTISSFPLRLPSSCFFLPFRARSSHSLVHRPLAMRLNLPSGVLREQLSPARRKYYQPSVGRLGEGTPRINSQGTSSEQVFVTWSCRLQERFHPAFSSFFSIHRTTAGPPGFDPSHSQSFREDSFLILCKSACWDRIQPLCRPESDGQFIIWFAKQEPERNKARIYICQV